MLDAGGGRGFGAGFGLGVSWWTYLLKQSEAIVVYLKLSFWPHPLVLDYGTAVVHSVSDVWWQGPVVIGLVAGTLWALVRKPVLGFAGAWFFVILAPSSSVMPIVTQTMAEHRMYLPLAAVIASCVLGLHALLKRLPDCATAGPPSDVQWSVVPWSSCRLPVVLFLALACLLGWLTVSRIRDYRDVMAIWADNVAKCPQVARGHNNLAWALQQQGKTAQANAHFARAVALEPGYVTARYDWGVALLDQGRVAEAIAQFEAAVQLAPDHADAYVNLGNALMQVQRAVEAIPQYETALRLKPAADAHYDLGVALAEVGRPEDAAGHFRAALQINPALPEAHYQLARLAERAGQPAAAELQYLETLRLAPDHAAAQGRLGLLLARAGRLPAAAEHLRAAVRLKPADAEARVNLGNVFLLQGQAREAVACYEEAVRLRPDDARIRENLQLAREALH
jgi:tetratricopeptide (TPR) repeat protein